MTVWFEVTSVVAEAEATAPSTPQVWASLSFVGIDLGVGADSDVLVGRERVGGRGTTSSSSRCYSMWQ